MAQVNAGRVRFVGRGEYNNSTQYYVFDLVSYNGNSYYAKADTIGNLPTNTTYWQLVAEKGNVGPTGLTGNGIASIEKTSTSGLVDTYTITYTNGNTTTFDVSNGNGIDRIEKTATVGNKDTYTIYFTNGSTTTYEVANGEVTREELEEEVERLSMIYNAFPSTTGEVEEGSINGTAEVPFKEIGLKGNTSQESTTGKNLFDISKVITNWNTPTNTGLRNNNDGTLSVSSPSASTTSIGLTPNTLKDYCPNLKVGDVVYLNATTTGTKKYIYLDISANLWTFGTSRTITQNDLDSKVYWYASGVSTTTTISDIMISTSGGDYEPYTGGNPAPNPDYPYPVNVVTGDNEVKVEGKNLAQSNWATDFVTAVNNQYVYMTTRDNRTCLRYTPGAGYGSYDTKNLSLGIKFKENTQYTLSFDVLKEENNSNTIAFYYTDGTYTNGGGTSAINTWEHKTITSSANKTIMYIAPFYTSGSTNIDINTYQIEEGTTETTYEPYQSQTYPINLGSMELCKIGDYQDYIYKENGIWYKYGAIGKVVLDGSESYSKEVATNSLFSIIISDMLSGNNVRGYSSHFRDYRYHNDVVGAIAFGWNDKRVFMYVSTSIATTNDFQTWLSLNNVSLYYILATPTITPITDTILIEQLDNLEKAYSYDTQTNISQTNQDKPFIISYEAILSLRNVLNS